MALILEVLERAFDSKVQISEMFTNCTAQIFMGVPPPLFVFYSPLLAKTGCKTLTCPYIEELGSVKRMQGNMPYITPIHLREHGCHKAVRIYLYLISCPYIEAIWSL